MSESIHHRICREHNNYPNNIIRSSTERPYRTSLVQKLGNSAQRLFSSSQASIQIRTYRPGEYIVHNNIKDLREIIDHLNSGSRMNPELRHVCIRTDYSTRTFRCSIEMFTYLMSFYIVPPIITDFVTSFDHSRTPVNKHLSAFYAGKDHPPGIWSDQDNRFLDRIIRHFYQIQYLRKVRHQLVPWEPYTWEVQHLVVYHYFDPSLEKSHWITIMGDGLASDEDLSKLGGGGTTPSDFNIFEASLSTHIDLYRWCSEAWQDFTIEFYDELHKLKKKAQDIQHPNNMDNNTFPHSSDARATTEPTGLLREDRSERQQEPMYWDMHQLDSSAPDSSTPLLLEERRPENGFQLRDVQKLSRIKDRLAEASLAIKLNQTILTNLGQAYKSIAQDFPERKMHLDRFTSQIESLQCSTRYYEAQLHSLTSLHEDVKSLIDDIREFQDLCLHRTFAEMSLASEQRMERLASEANRQAMSMNIITIITLIFLPSTFVTTFMQSGIFQWTDSENWGSPESTPIKCWFHPPE
ncbi:hypothetical protein F4806DRAFT_505913 [Annulohypoxylon nitens]|nr:hypothetical protein F4806DRAFT_505913 [Annulohypoxylon nitens]